MGDNIPAFLGIHTDRIASVTDGLCYRFSGTIAAVDCCTDAFSVEIDAAGGLTGEDHTALAEYRAVELDLTTFVAPPFTEPHLKAVSKELTECLDRLAQFSAAQTTEAQYKVAVLFMDAGEHLAHFGQEENAEAVWTQGSVRFDPEIALQDAGDGS